VAWPIEGREQGHPQAHFVELRYLAPFMICET
jgi:hypothetical protein